MAQKVRIILVDDIDGGTAEETVRFGLDGANYEIDLSADNATKLRGAISEYVAAGRKQSRTATAGTRTRGTGAAPRNSESAKIRQWARDNGYQVNSRGRIQSDIQAAYEKATA